jgi:hypothetical protein
MVVRRDASTVGPRAALTGIGVTILASLAVVAVGATLAALALALVR